MSDTALTVSDPLWITIGFRVFKSPVQEISVAPDLAWSAWDSPRGPSNDGSGRPVGSSIGPAKAAAPASLGRPSGYRFPDDPSPLPWHGHDAARMRRPAWRTGGPSVRWLGL